MRPRRDICSASSQRLALAGAVLLFLAAPSAALAQFTMVQGQFDPNPTLVQTSLLPPDFFEAIPYAAGEQAAIEADRLTYAAETRVVTAEGDVVMTYKGNILKADRIVYDQSSGAVTASGNVLVVQPDGTEFAGNDVKLSGGFRQAFIQSLAIRRADGSMVTADSADYSSEVSVILVNGMYSPCGACIDSKGRHIGWTIRAKRFVYDREAAVVDMEEPVLELLGVPMAWLPWLRIPDPSQPRVNGFRLPTVDYTTLQGANITVPYFLAIGDDTDIIFSPRLMSRQGLLFAAQAVHRFGPLGSVEAKVAGLYQLDRSAFAGTVGDRDWRGAVQTSGQFTPLPTWTTGWSYTAFTDAAFLPDYKLTTTKNLINEVYLTHLSKDYWLDLRVQQFNLLGNVTPAQQLQQGLAVPNFKTSSTTDLADGWGQIRTSLRVLGVHRDADHTDTFNGVPYVFAYRENKAHATLEGSWQTQVIVPGGIAITPYLGIRADAAWYDGSSGLLAGPVSLLTATPIAALDVRWPVIATSGQSSFLFEPIAQIAYRGSTVTAPGITNDNALSFVFDDTLLFSYDRFSGTDRQETGLRANIGGHYVANFEDGSWLDLIAGQSFFLGGVNSLATADTANVGISTGLGLPASYFVVGAKAGIGGFTLGGKAQIDVATPKVALAAVRASYGEGRFSADIDYTYIAADPLIGVVADQHEVTLSAGVPIADYWRATALLGWDLAQNTWLEAGAGLEYDDGYLAFGASGRFTGPTHTSPNGFTASASIRLKSPDGEFALSR